MKKIVVAVVATSSMVFAGGGFKTVEPVVAVPVVMEENVNPFYLGLGLSAVSTRDSDVDMDFFDNKEGQDRLGNVTLLAGYNFNEYVAVEGRYTTSITDEDVVSMDYGWSLFVKPQYPVSEDFSVYALLGYGGVKLDGKRGVLADVDDTGFQWGLGASYAINEDYILFVDYTSLSNDMDGIYTKGGTYYNGATEIDIDAVTIGVNYLF